MLFFSSGKLVVLVAFLSSDSVSSWTSPLSPSSLVTILPPYLGFLKNNLKQENGFLWMLNLFSQPQNYIELAPAQSIECSYKPTPQPTSLHSKCSRSISLTSCCRRSIRTILENVDRGTQKIQHCSCYLQDVCGCNMPTQRRRFL